MRERKKENLDGEVMNRRGGVGGRRTNSHFSRFFVRLSVCGREKLRMYLITKSKLFKLTKAIKLIAVTIRYNYMKKRPILRKVMRYIHHN
jgi:hypothetical protein